MENNKFTQPIITLETLHGSVGLLRARISYLMKTVSDTRLEHHRTFKQSSDELYSSRIGLQHSIFASGYAHLTYKFKILQSHS